MTWPQVGVLGVVVFLVCVLRRRVDAISRAAALEEGATLPQVAP